MKFTKIDLQNWERKENYEWFTKYNKCRINMTVNIDITILLDKIKSQNFRCYPIFTYMVSCILNKYDEYKTYNNDENLVIWDTINPRYPIFHNDSKRISILWTEYSDDFKKFYNDFICDANTYGKKLSMLAKGKYPPNVFDMSSLPWSSFTSFSCPDYGDGLSLSPFIMIGKFFKENNKILVPLSATMHHATCDGYHVSRFFNEFQELALNPDKWFFV